MSASVRAPADDRNIELGNATNWRLIVAAAGLGLVVLIAAVVLGLAAAAAPKTEPAIAQATVVPAQEQDTLLPTQPEPKSQPQPQPAVVVAIAKPAWPHKPKVTSKPVSPPAPVVEVTSEPAKPTQVAEATPAQSFKRYSQHGEAELRERVYREARELDVETEKGTTAKLLAEAAKATKRSSADKDADKPQAKTPPILEVIAKRPDLKGLPVREVDKCQVPANEATIMAEMSRTVRADTAELKSQKNPAFSYEGQWEYDQSMVVCLEDRFSKTKGREDAGVRLMVQIFQIENELIRTKMVTMLAKNKGKSATVALAQRAVFDLNPDVRLAAITALKKRPPAEVRPVLLEALRYPWAPVAKNAAEALVALNDHEAVTEMVSLLDKPDPQAPFQNKDKKWVTAELVRVNHLGNCVLCHAPCSANEDTVRGVVPERGKPLPVAYYESERGSFVRADVTYLKQDFSIMQRVLEPGKWPTMQRFDYLIRQRELNADEVKHLTQAEKVETEIPMYPQRRAVLWALSELTGENIGARSADWNHYIQNMKTERMKCAP